MEHSSVAQEILVAEEGLEPSHSIELQILSLMCLPIPPFGQPA